MEILITVPDEVGRQLGRQRERAYLDYTEHDLDEDARTLRDLARK